MQQNSDFLAAAPGLLMLAFFIYMATFLIVYIRAEKTCLEEGYPKVSVTYDLSVYCSNLDGNVTVKVDKQ